MGAGGQFRKLESTHSHCISLHLAASSINPAYCRPSLASPSAFLYYSTSCSRQNLFSSSTLFDLALASIPSWLLPLPAARCPSRLVLVCPFCTATPRLTFRFYCNDTGLLIHHPPSTTRSSNAPDQQLPFLNANNIDSRHWLWQLHPTFFYLEAHLPFNPRYSTTQSFPTSCPPRCGYKSSTWYAQAPLPASPSPFPSPHPLSPKSNLGGCLTRFSHARFDPSNAIHQSFQIKHLQPWFWLVHLKPVLKPCSFAASRPLLASTVAQGLAFVHQSNPPPAPANETPMPRNQERSI